MYKLCPDSVMFGQPNSVIRMSDGACIPMNTDNADYQAYLKWLSEGNQPLPAN